MQIPKLLLAAIVFGIVVISISFFISQTAKPALAQGQKITGTIVLANAEGEAGASTFALPSTSCNIEVIGCGTNKPFAVIDSRRGFPLLNQSVGLLDRDDQMFPENIVESDSINSVYYWPENGSDMEVGTTPEEALNKLGFQNCLVLDIYTYGENKVYNCQGTHFFVTKKPTQLNNTPNELYYVQKLRPDFVNGPKTKLANSCTVFIAEGIPAQNYTISTIEGATPFDYLAVSYSCT